MVDIDMLDAASIIDRMKKCMRASSDARLAAALGVSPGAVSLWRKKDNVPASQVVRVGQETGISLDWLFTGKDIGEVQHEGPEGWYKDMARADSRPERFLLEVSIAEVMYWSRQMGFTLDKESPAALAGKIYLSYENNQVRYFQLTSAGGFGHDEAVAALMRPFRNGDEAGESV
jgi:hypothetical protein